MNSNFSFIHIFNIFISSKLFLAQSCDEALAYTREKHTLDELAVFWGAGKKAGLPESPTIPPVDKITVQQTYISAISLQSHTVYE